MKIVLVVDDNRPVNKYIERYLIACGYSVLSCITIGDVIGCIDACEHVDIAIVDYRLVDGSGDTVVEMLHAKWPGLPIIYTSGGDWPGKPVVLSKPFQISQLMTLIKERIGEP